MNNTWSGKSDEEWLCRVQYHLMQSGIEPAHILRDNYILASRDTYTVLSIVEQVKMSQANPDGPTPLIIHPDLTILNRSGFIYCIIEIDGSIHKTKPGLKKTAKRNQLYKDMKIPLIILDLEDLEYMGEKWNEYLDKELNELAQSMPCKVF